MAKDGVMPKQFAFRGDRLAFSNGIIVLGVASSAVLVVFHADTHKIIPLYAFGVFMAFTLSQAGMVVHWRAPRGARLAQRPRDQRRRRRRHRRRRLIIVGATKFTHGAWLSIAIMIVLVVVLWRIRVHYDRASTQLGAGLSDDGAVREYFNSAAGAVPQTVIVPVEGIDRAVLRTVAYARTISPNAIAIHVTDDREAGEDLRRRWEESLPDMPLVIVESPYRSLVEPIIAYIDGWTARSPTTW